MKSNLIIVALIFLIFSVISFLTNILGPLVPDIIDSFDLSIGIAGFLPFSFFVAYGIMSIPSGILIERYSEKTVLIAGFVLAFVAAIVFAIFPTFQIALLSLFSIGIGMAMLQVVINPLLPKAFPGTPRKVLLLRKVAYRLNPRAHPGICPEAFVN